MQSKLNDMTNDSINCFVTRAMLELDQILKANEINFAILAALPAFVLSLLLLMLVRAWIMQVGVSFSINFLVKTLILIKIMLKSYNTVRRLGSFELSCIFTYF